jgi:hypothetical protein
MCESIAAKPAMQIRPVDLTVQRMGDFQDSNAEEQRAQRLHDWEKKEHQKLEENRKKREELGDNHNGEFATGILSDSGHGYSISLHEQSTLEKAYEEDRSRATSLGGPQPKEGLTVQEMKQECAIHKKVEAHKKTEKDKAEVQQKKEKEKIYKKMIAERVAAAEQAEAKRKSEEQALDKDKRESKEEKRRQTVVRVASELLATEIVYVAGLEDVKTFYIDPLLLAKTGSSMKAKAELENGGEVASVDAKKERKVSKKVRKQSKKERLSEKSPPFQPAAASTVTIPALQPDKIEQDLWKFRGSAGVRASEESNANLQNSMDGFAMTGRFESKTTTNAVTQSYAAIVSQEARKIDAEVLTNMTEELRALGIDQILDINRQVVGV